MVNDLKSAVSGCVSATLCTGWPDVGPLWQCFCGWRGGCPWGGDFCSSFGRHGRFNDVDGLKFSKSNWRNQSRTRRWILV